MMRRVCCRPFFGSNIQFWLIGKKEQSHLIVVGIGTKSKQRTDFGDEFLLPLPAHAKKRRATHIYEQHNRQFALLFVNFNVWIARAGCYIPINIAHIVAKLVLPHLTKRHTPSFKGTMVSPREKIACQPTGFDFDFADFLDQFFHFTRRSLGEGGFSRLPAIALQGEDGPISK